MGRLRGRRGEGGTKYRMREKVFAIGDDFWIEDDSGERAFKIDGKALRVRDTFVLEDDALILAVTVCIDQMSRG